MLAFSSLFSSLTRLAVLRKDDVLRFQGRRASHVNGLLAVLGHVEGYPTLSLGVVKYRVHLAQAYHLAVRTEEGVGRSGVGIFVPRWPQQFARLEFGGEVGMPRNQRRSELREVVHFREDVDRRGICADAGGGVRAAKAATFILKKQQHEKKDATVLFMTILRERDLIMQENASAN